jgi:Protein of unknown function (DUF3866)
MGAPSSDSVRVPVLKLRRAIVLDAGPPGGGPEQDLVIELVDGAGGRGAKGRTPKSVAGAGGKALRRPAIADVALLGRAEVGDELIVNVQARDLGLGSGGFDIVHVNLTRGLGGEEDWDPARPAHPVRPAPPNVMKLNYTSLQHTVEPVEELGGDREPSSGSLERPVAVLALHGQLAAVAWAFAQQAPAGSRLGYVQTVGGALPGGHSRTVRSLRERGLLAGHLTAGAAFGGEGEAITTVGALDHGLRGLGWDAAICGPGPGIVGSSSPLGHGGMSALDSAHAALALGASTLLVARMSSGDPRARHRGISHHTLTVLDMLLEPVTVALPAGMRSPVGADLRAGLGAVFGGALPSRPIKNWGHTGGTGSLELDVERPADRRSASILRHDWRRAIVDLPAYAAAGLPTETMGRGLTEDPLFFAAALAAGATLAELVGDTELSEDGVGEAERSIAPPGRS